MTAERTSTPADAETDEKSLTSAIKEPRWNTTPRVGAGRLNIKDSPHDHPYRYQELQQHRAEATNRPDWIPIPPAWVMEMISYGK